MGWPPGAQGHDDVEKAIGVGVDGVVAANHGARQFNGAPATIDVLPPIVEQLVATGDGCYYFGNPTAAHSVAASPQLPFITVIYNNGKRATVANHTNRWYAELEEPEPPLTGLGPQPAFHKIVESFGGYGECVTTVDELPGALARSIAAARNGQQALNNVICESPIERGEVH